MKLKTILLLLLLLIAQQAMGAVYYVRSAAAGSADGSSWTNAYTTLAAALTARSAGDTFYVSEDHAETQASAMTLTSPGTPASPCLVLCGNHANTPPTSVTTGATISTTGSSSISFAGTANYDGIVFTAGNSTGTASITLNSASTTNVEQNFANCTLALGGSNAANVIGSASGGGCVTKWNNTKVSFASTSQSIQLTWADLLWTNTASAIQGTVPGTLFIPNTSRAAVHRLSGVDLSAAGSGKNILNVAKDSQFAPFVMSNCKLGASVTLTTGTAVVTSPRFTAIDCDSANTNYKFAKRDYRGNIDDETTIVKSSGSSDGTTPISYKMVSSANSKFYSPLVFDGPALAFWNDTTSSTTVTVEVVTDNVTLTNADMWIEVEELGTSSFPLSTFSSSRATDIIASPSNLSSSSVTWTTTGLSTPLKQKMAVTFTPSHKGMVVCRVYLAKASTTVYVDGLILPSSGRQYIAGPGALINEAPSSVTNNNYSRSRVVNGQ